MVMYDCSGSKALRQSQMLCFELSGFSFIFGTVTNY